MPNALYNEALSIKIIWFKEFSLMEKKGIKAVV